MVVLAARGAFRNKNVSDAVERDKVLLEFKLKDISSKIIAEITNLTLAQIEAL